MEKMNAARLARKVAMVMAMAGVVSTLGVSTAGARPGIGLTPRLPVTGSLVNLACANPANAGLVGKVLGPAHVQFGGALRCFSEAVAAQSGRGPLIMAGPTGLGPTQIQSAYKLSGLNGAGRTVALVDAYND